ncbi:hypothetical protein TIFTF001_037070 [Ficus carica]|uniref:Uncharacterized protein n=1 Tax=Ficus carica TaxID=3494 RepID=A0AA88E4K2_FICCA|nr:hypothetical protein TIFTF001_037070 [Ficus carica]
MGKISLVLDPSWKQWTQLARTQFYGSQQNVNFAEIQNYKRKFGADFDHSRDYYSCVTHVSNRPIDLRCGPEREYAKLAQPGASLSPCQRHQAVRDPVWRVPPCVRALLSSS